MQDKTAVHLSAAGIKINGIYLWKINGQAYYILAEYYQRMLVVLQPIKRTVLPVMAVLPVLLSDHTSHTASSLQLKLTQLLQNTASLELV